MTIFKCWETKLAHLRKWKVPPTVWDGGTGRDWAWWAAQDGSESFALTLLQDLRVAAKAVRFSVRADRATMRVAADHHLNQLADTGRLKKVIKAALGRYSKDPTITLVETSDGYLTNPLDIHAHLTAGWHSAFTRDTAALGVRNGLEPLGTQADPVPAAAQWESFLVHPDFVVQAFQPEPGTTAVPENLRRKIGEAIGSIAHRQDMLDEMAKVCHAPFSRAEFDRLISTSKKWIARTVRSLLSAAHAAACPRSRRSIQAHARPLA